MINPDNATSSGLDHSDPWNRSSAWWDRSWQSQGQWSDRSWRDNSDWDNRARSTQPTSSTETSGWNRRSRASSAATWQEEAARSNRTPRRDSRFTQDRNLTNSLLLTAKGLECIHPSVSFPLIRTDTTLKVCISVWEADMKILVTPPTADEYLLNMLCVYAELCFTKFDASHFAKCRRAH